ncbi:MAG: hypothetical protein ACYDDQ_09055 [Vulcanimicrobiaceae bacterium]
MRACDLLDVTARTKACGIGAGDLVRRLPWSRRTAQHWLAGRGIARAKALAVADAFQADFVDLADAIREVVAREWSRLDVRLAAARAIIALCGTLRAIARENADVGDAIRATIPPLTAFARRLCSLVTAHADMAETLDPLGEILAALRGMVAAVPPLVRVIENLQQLRAEVHERGAVEVSAPRDPICAQVACFAALAFAFAALSAGGAWWALLH